MALKFLQCGRRKYTVAHLEEKCNARSNVDTLAKLKILTSAKFCKNNPRGKKFV